MIFQFGSADLGSLQVAQDAKRLALFAADPADHLDEAEFLFMSAMGKIQAHDIDTGAHQVTKHGHGIRRRTQSGNDFCAALRDRVVQAGFSEWHSDYSTGGKAVGILSCV